MFEIEVVFTVFHLFKSIEQSGIKQSTSHNVPSSRNGQGFNTLKPNGNLPQVVTLTL
jgi:hypothetical protein